VSTLACALKSFAQACQKPAGEVVAADIETWLYAGDYTPQTRKGRHTALSTAFNWLVKRKLVAGNPVAAVDAPAVAFKKPEILSVDDIEKILRACERHDPALLGHCCMILYGGLRRGESARALPENVIGGVIELTGDQTKLNCARNVKISETLAAWLAVPGVELGGKHLFKRMKKIRELAGVEIPQNALRHSSASYHRELMGGIESARILGHSETVSLKSYSAKVTHADAERFFALRPTPVISTP
jgi:site-specific recombinase XerD